MPVVCCTVFDLGFNLIVIDVVADKSRCRPRQQPPVVARPGNVVHVTIVGKQPQDLSRVDAVVGREGWKTNVPRADHAVAGTACKKKAVKFPNGKQLKLNSQKSQVGFSEWKTSVLTAIVFLSTGRHSWKQTLWMGWNILTSPRIPPESRMLDFFPPRSSVVHARV